MINYRIDESNERQPLVLQVNSNKIRLYFDHTEERTEDVDRNVVTIYKAKFIELDYFGNTDSVALARRAVLNEIDEYDISTSVNVFTFNGTPMWFDKATRTGLLLRIQAEKSIGNDTTTLWFGTQSYEIPIDKALEMLYDIEVYASKCYDVTAAHKAMIGSMDSVDDITNYDYTTGYPEKLNFEV